MCYWSVRGDERDAGKLLAQLDPSLKIMMVERLAHVAHESRTASTTPVPATPVIANSTTRRNSGRQHQDRPRAGDQCRIRGLVAVLVVSVEQRLLPASEKFIIRVPPELRLGRGERRYLRSVIKLAQASSVRGDGVQRDHAVLHKWMPLVMRQRDPKQKIAATRVQHGTDVDFGFLTRKLVKALQKLPNFELKLSHTITSMKQHDDGRWHVRVKDGHAKTTRTINAGFVFLGAGGGALPLLQKSGIPEARAMAVSPVSGQC